MKIVGLPFTFLVFLVSVGCSAAVAPGTALLPEGIGEARIPDVESNGYLYVSSDSPIKLPLGYLDAGQIEDALSGSTPQYLEMHSTALVIGPSPGSFGGMLEFASDLDAATAWKHFEPKTQQEETWGIQSSPVLSLAHGDASWLTSVREAIESNQTISLSEYDPAAWGSITSLPENPVSRPIAAGVFKLEPELTSALGDRVGISLEGISDIFGLVRVNTLAFGVYVEGPIVVPEKIDHDLMHQSDIGILFVSQSNYPGPLVSFLLSVVAGRTEMEIIDLGNTNARYRLIEDLHLVIKNKGSAMYAALAGTRENAERLIMSALSN